MHDSSAVIVGTLKHRNANNAAVPRSACCIWIGKPGGGPTQFRGDPRCGGGEKNGHGKRGGGGKCK
jgi:hypothetical protein